MQFPAKSINRCLVVLVAVLSFGCTQQVDVIKTRYRPAEQPQPADRTAQSSADSLFQRTLDEGLRLLQQDSLMEAGLCFDRALAIDSSQWMPYYYLAGIDAEKENYSKARAHLFSSLEKAPVDKQVRSLIYSALAESWESEGNLGRAHLDFLTALNLDPNSKRASEGLDRIEQTRTQSGR
ncbi:MAG: hypothetical protein AB1744_06530 [Candidatus Zixiibacteriota bacterium]